jgi:hypothetical protein
MDQPENESHTGNIAPNPLAFYSIITAVLTNLAGVLTRALEGAEPGQTPGSMDFKSIQNFSDLAEKSLLLQSRHQSLLSEGEGGQKPVYPIGVEMPRWSSSKQGEVYKNIRDQALDLFKSLTDLTVQNPQFKLSSEDEKLIQRALEIIQSSVYQVQTSKTYDEGSTFLAYSLQITAATFEGLLNRKLPPGNPR